METRHANIRCSECGSNRLSPVGVGGVVGKIGYDQNIHEDIEYKCLDCKNRFFVLKRLNADHDDFEAPFTIIFTREKRFTAALHPQSVYLNGFLAGVVKNGQTIQFTTNKLNNEIVVTDHNGMAFSDYLTFAASEGGFMQVKFAFKFVK